MIRKRNLRNRVLNRNTNRIFYETIMRDVAKTVKKHLNEGLDLRLYPEDYSFYDNTDVIDALIDVANDCNLFYYIAKAEFFNDINFDFSDPKFLNYVQTELRKKIDSARNDNEDEFVEEQMEKDQEEYKNSNFANQLEDLLYDDETNDLIPMSSEDELLDFIKQHKEELGIEEQSDYVLSVWADYFWRDFY